MATFEGLQAELAGLKKVDGITPVEILVLPQALQGALRKMVKTALTSEELAGELHLTTAESQQLADILVAKGFLRVQPRADGDGVAYKVYFARMPRHDIPVDL